MNQTRENYIKAQKKINSSGSKIKIMEKVTYFLGICNIGIWGSADGFLK